MIAASALATAAVLLAGAASGGPAQEAALHLSRDIGVRPAGSAAELRAHRYAASRFRAAGLATREVGFAVPTGSRRSRDVVGVLNTSARCLDVVMAHGDSVRRGRGAIDNASGAGVAIALAAQLRALRPRCDVWLAVTGAEEREVTGSPDHLGARALVRDVRRRGRASELRFALSVDEVGFGRRFTLRSPHARPRAGVEGRVLRAARARDVPVDFSPDSATGNSDHREFELSGLPAAALEVEGGVFACHHRPCDTPDLLDPASSALARRVVATLLTLGDVDAKRPQRSFCITAVERAADTLPPR